MPSSKTVIDIFTYWYKHDYTFIVITKILSFDKLKIWLLYIRIIYIFEAYYIIFFEHKVCSRRQFTSPVDKLHYT